MSSPGQESDKRELDNASLAADEGSSAASSYVTEYEQSQHKPIRHRPLTFTLHESVLDLDSRYETLKGTRRRRLYTAQERLRVAKARKIGVCSECRARKVKCKHVLDKDKTLLESKSGSLVSTFPANNTSSSQTFLRHDTDTPLDRWLRDNQESSILRHNTDTPLDRWLHDDQESSILRHSSWSTDISNEDLCNETKAYHLKRASVVLESIDKAPHVPSHPDQSVRASRVLSFPEYTPFDASERAENKHFISDTDLTLSKVDKGAEINDLLSFSDHEPIIAFPSRVPVAGEGTPWDMVDGEIRTQPRRRRQSQRSSLRLHPYQTGTFTRGQSHSGSIQDMDRRAFTNVSLSLPASDTSTLEDFPLSTPVVGVGPNSFQPSPYWINQLHDEPDLSTTNRHYISNHGEPPRDRNVSASNLQTNSSVTSDLAITNSNSLQHNSTIFDFGNAVDLNTLQQVPQGLDFGSGLLDLMIYSSSSPAATSTPLVELPFQPISSATPLNPTVSNFSELPLAWFQDSRPMETLFEIPQNEFSATPTQSVMQHAGFQLTISNTEDLNTTGVNEGSLTNDTTHVGGGGWELLNDFMCEIEGRGTQFDLSYAESNDKSSDDPEAGISQVNTLTDNFLAEPDLNQPSLTSTSSIPSNNLPSIHESITIPTNATQIFEHSLELSNKPYHKFLPLEFPAWVNYGEVA